VTDTPNITHMILEKIQDDIAALRDRLCAFEARMDRRWEANDARWEANEARWAAAEAHWKELAGEQRSWRERFDREQAVRERQARKSLELFDVLIRKVAQLDDRITTIEGTPDRSP
jgi:hypothetical protein